MQTLATLLDSNFKFGYSATITAKNIYLELNTIILIIKFLDKNDQSAVELTPATLNYAVRIIGPNQLDNGNYFIYGTTRPPANKL